MKIDKKDLERLAGLAKIDIGDPNKLLGSIRDILNYVEELNEADVLNIVPMNGGTSEKNVFRPDKRRGEKITEECLKEAELIKNNFPDEKDDYLKVPAVFE